MENISALIPVHNTGKQQTVSARQLYEFLGYNPTQWQRWYKKNITGNQFLINNKDYQVLDIMSKTSGGRPTQDFEITLDVAKKMSMQAPGEKGEQARNYFLECERKAQSPALSSAEVLLQSVQLLVEQQRQITEVKEEQTQIKESIEDINLRLISRPEGLYTVAAYGVLTKRSISNRTASNIGKMAAKACKAMGRNIGKITDEKWGYINIYPKDVLESVFNDYFQVNSKAV